MAFPMDADHWMMDRIWVVSHQPIAVAAGLERMGMDEVMQPLQAKANNRIAGAVLVC